jgi:hypothetical protein
MILILTLARPVENGLVKAENSLWGRVACIGV